MQVEVQGHNISPSPQRVGGTMGVQSQVVVQGPVYPGPHCAIVIVPTGGRPWTGS